jgi:hypothetical protein
MNSTNGSNEAVSSPASAEHISPQTDFELQKLEDGRWRLRANTRHGLYWMKSSDMQHDDGELHLNLMSANDFLRRARRQGLKTEYIGPMGRSIL